MARLILARARGMVTGWKKDCFCPVPVPKPTHPRQTEAERYVGDPPGGGSTICPVGVRGYGGGSASRFSASFLIKFETYELGCEIL